VDLDPETAKKTQGFEFIVIPQLTPEKKEERRVSFNYRR
jgi:hypothetical protein